MADVLDADEVRLRLPWDPTNTTIANMVHGDDGAGRRRGDGSRLGGRRCPDSLRGVTTSMSTIPRAGPRDRPDRDRAGTAAQQSWCIATSTSVTGG